MVPEVLMGFKALKPLHDSEVESKGTSWTFNACDYLLKVLEKLPEARDSSYSSNRFDDCR